MKNVYKFLLMIGVAGCLVMASKDVYKFYKQRVPPFSEGTCVILNEEAYVKVVDNDWMEAVSNMEIMVFPGVWLEASLEFEALRNIPYKEVKCAEGF